MTYQDAMDNITCALDGGCHQVCNAKYRGGCKDDLIIDSVKTIRELVRKSDKYKWHDLRKNPEDLPIEKTNMHIVFAGGGQTLVTYYPNSKYKYSSISYGNEEDGYVNYTDVIAWREIEPFEEV